MGLMDVASHILEAAEASEKMLAQLLKCAPLEESIKLLGEEMKKTSRRINALNEYLLPRLRSDVKRIEAVLDEREREDTFRLKMIKGKKEREKKKKRKAAEALAS